MAANPMKNLINNMVMGNSMAAMQNPNSRVIGADAQTMNGAMGNIEGAWANSVTMQNQMDQKQMLLMQQAWAESHAQEMMRMRQHEAMNQVYQAEMEKSQAEAWKTDFIENEVLNAKEKELNAAFDEAKIQENMKQVEYNQATNNLVDLMSKDKDPRFKNSKFLDFLKKVQSGQYELKDNQLINHPEKSLAANSTKMQEMEGVFQGVASTHVPTQEKLNMMENAFVEAHNKVNIEDAKMNAMETDFKDATAEVEQDIAARADRKAKELQDMWSEMARNYDPQNPELMDKLQSQFEKAFEDWNEEKLADHWQVAQDIVEAQNIVQNQYTATPGENPYLNENNPQRIFLQKIQEGNTLEAIQALEAHTQKHPTDHTAWRMLGSLLQENDQDNASIPAIMKAIEINPNCSESLFQLGVSCTNVLDELSSMMYLQRWLRSIPEYQSFAGEDLVDQSRLTLDNYTAEECIVITKMLIERFEQAKMNGPVSAKLLMTLGVLYFISRDYKTAVENFQKSLHMDPTNYSGWNKFGAALAHLGQRKLSRDAYHKALDLKPNYMRAWINLAFSYGNEKDHESALNFYLNGLSLNPNAQHVWVYVESALVTLQEFDSIPMIKAKDPKVFGSRFNIVDHKSLPAPEGMTYLQIAEKYLINRNAEEWAKQFDNNGNGAPTAPTQDMQEN